MTFGHADTCRYSCWLPGTYHYTRFIVHRAVHSPETPEILATTASAILGLISRCVHDIMFNPKMRVLGQIGIGPYYIFLPGVSYSFFSSSSIFANLLFSFIDDTNFGRNDANFWKIDVLRPSANRQPRSTSGDQLSSFARRGPFHCSTLRVYSNILAYETTPWTHEHTLAASSGLTSTSTIYRLVRKRGSANVKSQ